MNSFSFDDPRCYDLIQPHIRIAIDAWAETGCPVGHFLTAVLSNNLIDAVGQADEMNLRALPAIVAYIYNEIPSGCWGSPEKVKEWRDSHAS